MIGLVAYHQSVEMHRQDISYPGNGRHILEYWDDLVVCVSLFRFLISLCQIILGFL